MQIDFRELRKADAPVALQGTVDLSRVAEENQQVEAIEPVSVDLVAEMSNDVVVVQGTLSTTLTYQCSRCLEPYQTSVRLKLHELFADEEQPGDEEVHVVTSHEVDLTPYLEETVNLAIEFQPLCSADCKGLCPACGADRNKEQCECDVSRPLDPRFAALEGLLSKDDSK